ncbi:outer membrane lipoprotein chaperone LolA [Gilvimarinus polysaccharolyticus]|uniref:outer membrane lipoprotein chaperone LolA n=1 Tax=Gilvimarinus polysaccharolyticus TaxID=863921 RepID=UPI0006735CCF|nr:outer membrane lipoprotein chaperone LolA [Gilvimarinus polysaccharolyticus]
MLKQLLRVVSVGLLTVLFSAVSSAAGPDNSANALRDTLAATTSLSGQFEQTLRDAEGETIEASSGSFVLQRPGRFFWHTQKPFEQQLISDGSTIWLYDPDLLQVTVRPVDDSLKATPAALLSESAESLTEAFRITRSVGQQGLEVFGLAPINEDGLFARLELEFDGQQLQRIIVHDSLGQTTEFALIDTVRNQPVDAAQFSFNAPEGVDVLID